MLQENRVPTKIRVVPSGILFQTLDLENIATASRSSAYQQNSSTVELVEHTDDGRCDVARRSMLYTHRARSLLHVRRP